MKVSNITFTILFIAFTSCKQESVELQYVPTDVIVKMKGSFSIEKGFDLINTLGLDVEDITSQTYRSSLPSDSLQYVLDYLNEKSYTNDGDAWMVNGYLHYETQQITIFPRLFDITIIENQEDWLKSMAILQLTEDTNIKTSGYIIFFHVPVGKEKEWENIFSKLDFVEWVELNYIDNINYWP